MRKINWTTIAILSIALLAVAVVLYFAIRPLTNGSNGNPFRLSPTVTFRKVDTADWQSYTDSAMGVQVKFPPQWSLDISPYQPGTLRVGSRPEGGRSDGGVDSGAAVQFVGSVSIVLRDVGNPLPIREWHERHFALTPLPGVVSMGEVALADYPALQVVTAEFNAVHYFVAQGGHVFDISFANESDRPSEFLNTYFNILSNLRFFAVYPQMGGYSVAHQDVIPSPIVQEEIDMDGYRYGSNLVLQPRGNSVSGEEVLTAPSGQRFLVSRAASSVLSDRLMGLTLPAHPLDQGSLLLSASDVPRDGRACENSLYTYNLNSGELTEFFHEETAGDSPLGTGNCSILYSIGLQGSKLLLVRTDPDNSGGPCGSVLLDRHLLYLELADVKSGLHPFRVPPPRIAQEETDMQQCLRELE